MDGLGRDALGRTLRRLRKEDADRAKRLGKKNPDEITRSDTSPATKQLPQGTFDPTKWEKDAAARAKRDERYRVD